MISCLYADLVNAVMDFVGEGCVPDRSAFSIFSLGPRLWKDGRRTRRLERLEVSSVRMFEVGSIVGENCDITSAFVEKEYPDVAGYLLDAKQRVGLDVARSFRENMRVSSG